MYGDLDISGAHTTTISTEVVNDLQELGLQETMAVAWWVCALHGWDASTYFPCGICIHVWASFAVWDLY